MAGHTPQPTALLNEAWIRLAGAPGEVRGHEHCLALPAAETNAQSAVVN